MGCFPGSSTHGCRGMRWVGVIDATGPGVAGFAKGQRVGVGWNGGYDGTCDACRRGDFFACQDGRVTGMSSDGGLGHPAVQYATKMGFLTVAIDRGQDKQKFAKELGAAEFIDSSARDAAAELTKLGGARVVLAIAPSASAMSGLIGGLAPRGKLLAVGVPNEPLSIPAAAIVPAARSVEGWYSGVSIDSEDTLAFSHRTGVRSMNEAFPLDRAPEAYARMLSGKMRYRGVLTMARR